MALSPTDKDHIIDAMEEDFDLDLSEDDYQRLHKMTQTELFLVMKLLSRTKLKRNQNED